MAALFDTNVFGMVQMLHAFLPLLARSAAPVVVNLSSGLSKTAGLADPGPVHLYPGVAYPASKTAVNTVRSSTQRRSRHQDQRRGRRLHRQGP
jgi:NAD(P)-dependent dehydrogenase (short-subunit alcohol dehydrogenase family)